MVVGNITELRIPGAGNSKNWETALAWLRKGEWKKLPEGKTEIDGQAVYAAVSSYETKLEGDGAFESHRIYGDIQVLIEGREIVYACDREDLDVTVPYDPEKDIDFLGNDGKDAVLHSVILGGDIAAVFLPRDAHMPCMAMENKSVRVRKLVVKVAL